jgi:hypothetical protein
MCYYSPISVHALWNVVPSKPISSRSWNVQCSLIRYIKLFPNICKVYNDGILKQFLDFLTNALGQNWIYYFGLLNTLSLMLPMHYRRTLGFSTYLKNCDVQSITVSTVSNELQMTFRCLAAYPLSVVTCCHQSLLTCHNFSLPPCRTDTAAIYL